jgi:hypothetical protein
MSQRSAELMQPQFDGVTHWLIRQAAHRAPECLASRLEEEWLADVECRSSALSRLRFAVGCCWATVVIVHEYPRDSAPAANPVATGLIPLTDRRFGYVSLRSGTLFLIVGIHATVFSALIMTLSHTPGMAVRTKLQNEALIPVSSEIAVISPGG